MPAGETGTFGILRNPRGTDRDVSISQNGIRPPDFLRQRRRNFLLIRRRGDHEAARHRKSQVRQAQKIVSLAAHQADLGRCAALQRHDIFEHTECYEPVIFRSIARGLISYRYPWPNLRLRLCLEWVRFLVIFAFVLASCGRSEAPAGGPDPTSESGYAQATEQLAAIDRQAETALQNGKPDDAAALIEKGQPLQKKLVSVPHPTLEAAEAASDLDDLYGRMLLKNHHYGWARLMFQKNLARWKHWSPETAETTGRYKKAATQIDECDRQMTK